MSPPVSPLAGNPAPKSLLVDVPKLLAAHADLRQILREAQAIVDAALVDQ